MSDLETLQDALGITKDKPRVMTVVSVIGDNVRLEAGNSVVIVAGSWAIGTQLVIRAGNVESVIPSTVTVFYTD